MDRLGRAKCTVHLISAPDQPGRKKCITTYQKLRAYCSNEYCEEYFKKRLNFIFLPIAVMEASPLRTKSWYITYYVSYGRNILVGFIPFGLLAYFNYKTYKDVQFRKDKRLARSMLPNQSSENNNRIGRRMKEDNLARIFSIIVIVFMICHSPRLLLGKSFF